MKKILLLLSLMLPLTILAQDREPYETRSLKGQNITNVELKTSGGYLSVAASTADEARVEIYIQRDNGNKELSKSEIKSRLDEEYDLNVTVSGGKLIAIAKQKNNIRNSRNGLNISFHVFVPKNVSTDLGTSGGSIRLSGISGTQKFATSGGSLHINAVSGKINGRTSGGSIHVENSSDEVELSTSGGSIYAKNCNGNLRLTTSGGSLELSNLTGNVRATTSGGDVRGDQISGELYTHTSGGSIRLTELSCSVETSTSGGNIDVSVTTLGKYVKIRNSSGNIQLQLPKGKGLDLNLVGDRVSSSQLSNFTGKADDDEIAGSVNGGGTPVNATTGSGKIALAFR